MNGGLIWIMSKDAIWSYKVPGVHCAILATSLVGCMPRDCYSLRDFFKRNKGHRKQPQSLYPHFFNWSQLLYVYCALSFPEQLAFSGKRNCVNLPIYESQFLGITTFRSQLLLTGWVWRKTAFLSPFSESSNPLRWDFCLYQRCTQIQT